MVCMPAAEGGRVCVWARVCVCVVVMYHLCGRSDAFGLAFHCSTHARTHMASVFTHKRRGHALNFKNKGKQADDDDEHERRKIFKSTRTTSKS